MPQEIKIDFIDFWPNFLKHDNYFYHVLLQKYEVVINEVDPDITFMSCYGVAKSRYKNHRCKKIFFTGENHGLQHLHGSKFIDPPFEYDLTFTFDETNGKNIYLPLFILFINWFNVPNDHNRDISFLANLDNLLRPLENVEDLLDSKTKGCCFLAKRPVDIRINFCIEAQRVFQIDCAGPVLNNFPQIGGRGDQIHKIDFIKQYKSIVAFENSKHPGYLTEKILHGVCTRCVPVYWGADRVFEYFNPNNVISVMNDSDWPTAIQHVKQILGNDDQYINMVSEPALKRSVLDEFNPEKILSMIEA